MDEREFPVSKLIECVFASSTRKQRVLLQDTLKATGPVVHVFSSPGKKSPFGGYAQWQKNERVIVDLAGYEVTCWRSDVMMESPKYQSCPDATAVAVPGQIVARLPAEWVR